MEPYAGNDAVIEYFKTNDRETWTYKHFLNEIRETIIISPPYSDDWSGLDGAWYRRYIYHADKSDPEYDLEVLPKFSAPFWVDENDKRQQMKSFFQDIILEREKRNAVKNYVIEGVRVLNEARFRSSDEVTSAINKRYPEDQARGNEDDASHKRQCRQTENEPSQTPEDKAVVSEVTEVTDDEEWEFDTPQPSWLKKLIEERRLLISKDEPITTYKSSLKSIWWKIVDLSDPKLVDLLSESDLSDLNAMFSSALKDWTVLEPSAEKCLKSLSKLDSYQLRTIGETVRPKGIHGAILRLQEMISNRNPIILEAGDLFYDGYIDEDTEISHEEISLLDANDLLDPDVAYIFDLIRYTCEMIAKGIPNRENSERDIDVFIKRHIFSCFDDILDSHFGEVVSRASRDRRANAVDAPSNAEGYHVDWMFMRHDLGKDLSWGREFSVCERAGSKVENKRKVISNNLKGQKILRDMHRSLAEVISAEGNGMLSKPVLQAITKLLMPADFDIPTKYEELKSVIKISRIMLQIKKLLYTTITRFTLIKKRAEKEKLALGRMLVPVRKKEHRTPQKPKKK
ncbi:1888_t:CDS:10 [Acaulospora morrowiae]|uniref:1888_t:CDS:1 n=1 Tax=Acaulospora morrowiae TaxID=94023 RepID=A0A9N9AQV8_9GLOM|nr:1888_t:CDS:10 [Acaulospora morrowiae]